MTIIEAIDKRLEESVLLIRKENGYNIDVVEYSRGFIPRKDVINEPLIYWEFGTEENDLYGEAKDFQNCKLPLELGIYFKVSTDSNALIEAENVRKTLIKFIQEDKSILNKNNTLKLSSINYIKRRPNVIRSGPILDSSTNTMLVFCVSQIIYSRVVNNIEFI